MNCIVFSFCICLVFLYVPCTTAATLRIVAICTGDVDILPYWLQYHTALVGVENVLVVDKSEGKEEVFSILKDWNGKGIKTAVVSGFLDSTKKSRLIVELANKHFNKQDLVISINIEDFLVTFKDGKPLLGKAGVHACLEQFQSATFACANVQTVAYGCNKNPSTDSVETINTIHIPATPLAEQYPILYKFSYLHKFAELKCEQQSTLGILKFPTRAPKLMLETIVSDSIKLNIFKPEISVSTLKEHELYLFSLLTFKNHPWENKVRQLLRYVISGYDGISIPCKYGDIDLADMKTIVESVK
jgi:hypothetical protein